MHLVDVGSEDIASNMSGHPNPKDRRLYWSTARCWEDERDAGADYAFGSCREA